MSQPPSDNDDPMREFFRQHGIDNDALAQRLSNQSMNAIHLALILRGAHPANVLVGPGPEMGVGGGLLGQMMVQQMRRDAIVGRTYVRAREPPMHYCKLALPGDFTSEGESCVICMEDMHADDRENPCVTVPDGHSFHAECIEGWFAKDGDDMPPNYECPLCRMSVCPIEGLMPTIDGASVNIDYEEDTLPGFEENSEGTLILKFFIPATPESDVMYDHAYLPFNEEGQHVMNLLIRAWNQKLLYAVNSDGSWRLNGIELKSSRTGGPMARGYPDPAYILSVKECLAAAEIK